MFVLLAMQAALVSCYKTTYSEQLVEKAKIVAMTYVPSGHGTGVGYSMSGKGGVSITSVSIPERFGAALQCQHGSFVIEGRRARDLFSWTSQGQEVEVLYRTELHDGEAYRLDLLEIRPLTAQNQP